MPKVIPVRKCCGCGEGKAKNQLIRVVRSASGEVSLDTTGKKPGRGAYICPNPACLTKARKAKRFERSFECPIPAEVYEALEAGLVQLNKDNNTNG